MSPLGQVLPSSLTNVGSVDTGGEPVSKSLACAGVVVGVVLALLAIVSLVGGIALAVTVGGVGAAITGLCVALVASIVLLSGIKLIKSMVQSCKDIACKDEKVELRAQDLEKPEEQEKSELRVVSDMFSDVVGLGRTPPSDLDQQSQEDAHKAS